MGMFFTASRSLAMPASRPKLFAVTMIGLTVWQLMPAEWRFLPHPIYWTWLVSLATFFVVAIFDRRRIEI